jgi:transposase, mutator family
MLRLHGNLPSAEAVIFLLGAVAKGMAETTYARRLPDFQAWSIKWINSSNSNNMRMSPLLA